MARTGRKAKKRCTSHKTILPNTKKTIGDISVCEINMYETKDAVKLGVVTEYTVYRDTPTSVNLGPFTSHSYRRTEIKTGFTTLEEAITFAETL